MRYIADIEKQHVTTLVAQGRLHSINSAGFGRKKAGATPDA